jgi:hypothetical protein
MHLFDEFQVREVTLRNRIVVSPMCEYSSTPPYSPSRVGVARLDLSSSRTLSRCVPVLRAPRHGVVTLPLCSFCDSDGVG